MNKNELQEYTKRLEDEIKKSKSNNADGFERDRADSGGIIILLLPPMHFTLQVSALPTQPVLAQPVPPSVPASAHIESFESLLRKRQLNEAEASLVAEETRAKECNPGPCWEKRQ